MSAAIALHPARTCLDCENCALTTAGSYCLLFAQLLDSEDADDCDGYMPFGEL